MSSNKTTYTVQELKNLSADTSVDPPIVREGLMGQAVDGAYYNLKVNTSGEVVVDPTNLDSRYVNVSGDTMTGPLTIDGTTNAIQLVVEGNSSQTADLIKAQTSTQSSRFRVTNSGQIIHGSTIDETTSFPFALLGSTVTLTPTADIVGATTIRGALIQALTGATAYSAASLELIGLAGYARNNSTGTNGSLYGLNFIAANDVAGTVGSLFGIYTAAINNHASAVTTNLYGIYIGNSGTIGTVTNKYGLFIYDITSASTLNIAIRTGAGKVSLGDYTSIGNTSAANVPLTVTGAASQTGDFFDINNSSSAYMFKQDSNGVLYQVKRYNNVAGANECLRLWGGTNATGSGPMLSFYTYWAAGGYPTWMMGTISGLYNSADGGWAGNLVFNVNAGASATDSLEVFRMRDTGNESKVRFSVNANSTTALLVEQDGVKDNVLVVDTTNGRVGVNVAPSVTLSVGSPSAALVSNMANKGLAISDSSSGNILLGIENTNSSGSTSGSGIVAYSNDGAALVSGDRLGFMLFGGGRDASNISNSAGFVAYATADWSGTSSPSKMDIQVTASGTTSRTTIFSVDSTGTTTTGDSVTTGDTYWTGDGSGLPYGSVYGNDIAWTQATAVQNTWYEIADADMADGQLNLVTHDGNGKLTVTKAGRYLINYHMTVTCSIAGKELQSGISVSGTEANDGIDHEIATNANAKESLSSTAILDLAANATIEISIRTTDTGTPDISVEHLNLTLIMVGGT